MTKPQRITLSRAKGWRMPANTVKVDRSTRWGNPFTPDMLLASPSRDGLVQGEPIGILGAINAYRTSIETKLARGDRELQANLESLRGRNLACWCREGDPCHADVLLDHANRPAPTPVVISQAAADAMDSTMSPLH